MNYYKLLKKGYRITIDTTDTEYTPTVFYMDDGNIWLINEIFYRPIPHPTFTKETFNEHIEQMLEEGFAIIIKKEV